MLTGRERLAPSRDYQFGITHYATPRDDAKEEDGLSRKGRDLVLDFISSLPTPGRARFHGETKCIIIAINVRRSIKWELAIVLTGGKFHSQDLKKSDLNRSR